jgi:membrane protein implicated in regulation of membrane protease activity
MAGGVIVAELLTGTFYLLMLSLGLSAAALAAHAGMGLEAQIVAAAIVGGGAVVAWYFIKKRSQGSELANTTNNLDIGETVMVERWLPDGTARIKYRGADWTALHRPGEVPVAGPHRVAEVMGNRLVIEPLT